jgi:RNA polymerase sigma-70 factor (sigma-E family)
VGRDEEFATFVGASWAPLVRTGRLIAPDPADAEDLVQSALLKTYARWRSVHDPLAFTHAVVAQIAVRAGRRRWRGEIATAEFPDLAGADDYSGIESTDAMRRALAGLPASQRAVLVLRFYCDFSEAQTADALNCSPGTVKSRTHRALAALRLQPLIEHLEAADE